MNASLTPPALKPEPASDGLARRFHVTPMLELGVLVIAIAALGATYHFVGQQNASGQLFSPAMAAVLLLANLLPFVALIVLLGRRIARRRAARASLAGGGRLHIRLVAVFSLIASVPIVLTVIAASILFQSGVQLWGSQRARAALESTMALAKEGQTLVTDRWSGEAQAMAKDLHLNYPDIPAKSADFERNFLAQTYIRSLYQAVLFRVADGRNVEAMYAWEAPDDRVFASRVTGSVLNLLTANGKTYINLDSDVLWVITPIDRAQNLFLYVATPNNVDFLNRQNVAADGIIRDYEALQARSRSLQLKFNVALFAVALLIVGLAMWIALLVADRLVGPVDSLVSAARQVADGDLTVRVVETGADDEVGTLANAFNQMTGRIEQQNTALVTANTQLENRRALIEAVMAGVSAGVLATDLGRAIQIANQSAIDLLGADALVGAALADIAPELAEFDASGAREGIVQVARGAETRTLAVRIARTETGPILTFDDITQQVLDQRRAAWSDVARRIAHEIKNPLTPIQLAAERLQRRYGGKIESDDGTFARLTDTIIRQVGDLRRMVDEFSSFARMPKPVFRDESLVDIARQALFLHEVAHPGIQFELINEASEDGSGPTMVCDRRQLGQAFTNIVKNAVEAIEAKGDTPHASVVMSLEQIGHHVVVEVADSGVGLPADRDRIVEPYMTTRARGTGLGLAIVKKIVEEHLGTMTFADREGGGTIVRMDFDAGTLATLDQGATTPEPAGDGQLAALSRNRN
ncbi:sensor histidine kinase NtrY-like [Sphingomonas oligophenolica]|uniref:histidine kinase n=1 Tax=Sphingomonas oligophenolica TaxID=301154 RepID=A0A502CMZ9_9SPHN|nr:ATP-binding protein [Sphingomonas oligophenolica]TPG14278.1 HAMP domain-containing protein [Sphingomonas oligophenolica]